MSIHDFERYPLTFGPSPVHPLDRLSRHLGGAEVWAGRAFIVAIGVVFALAYGTSLVVRPKPGGRIVIGDAAVTAALVAAGARHQRRGPQEQPPAAAGLCCAPSANAAKRPRPIRRARPGA